MMASSYVTVPIKLCLDAGNDEYIIRCNFVGRNMSIFEVIVGAAAGYPAPPSPSQEVHEMKGLNRVKGALKMSEEALYSFPQFQGSKINFLKALDRFHRKKSLNKRSIRPVFF